MRRQIVGRTDTSGTQEFGVWQLTTLGSTLQQAADFGFDLAESGGDGTIAGRSWKIPDGRITPTMWTCR